MLCKPGAPGALEDPSDLVVESMQLPLACGFEVKELSVRTLFTKPRKASEPAHSRTGCVLTASGPRFQETRDYLSPDE